MVPKYDPYCCKCLWYGQIALLEGSLTMHPHLQRHKETELSSSFRIQQVVTGWIWTQVVWTWHPGSRPLPTTHTAAEWSAGVSAVPCQLPSHPAQTSLQPDRAGLAAASLLLGRILTLLRMVHQSPSSLRLLCQTSRHLWRLGTRVTVLGSANLRGESKHGKAATGTWVSILSFAQLTDQKCLLFGILLDFGIFAYTGYVGYIWSWGWYLNLPSIHLFHINFI